MYPYTLYIHQSQLKLTSKLAGLAVFVNKCYYGNALLTLTDLSKNMAVNILNEMSLPR